MSNEEEVDKKTKEILQAQKRLQWMFTNISTNKTLARLAKTSFANSLTNAMTEIQRRIASSMCEQMNEGLIGFSEEDLIEILETPEWGKKILPGIELALTLNCYRWRFKERFPILYNAHVEMLGQMALTDERVAGHLARKVRLLLALYDHDYFFNHDPVICRVMRPHKIGQGKKGKKPEVPQEDLALFVYNGRDVLAGTTSFALVSQNGIELESIDVNHIRVKLIKKQSLVNKAFCDGIYSSKGVRLPLLGLWTFWQAEFVEFLQRQTSVFLSHFLSSNEGLLEKKEAYSNLLLNAQRFIGDRLTPQEYWEEFLTIPAFREILTSKFFAQIVTDYTSQIGANATKIAFEMMTIL